VFTTTSVENTITAGAAAGPDGADGAHGDAFVLLRNVTVALGGGDDTLRLELLATGPGTNRLTVRDSAFDGGAGWDSIAFGAGQAEDAPVFVDVGAGTVRFGRPGAPANALTGFEEFLGTGGNDRFRDGAGDQIYQGGGGDDLFVFFARNQGHDRILDLDEGDVVALRGFGARLNSFETLLDLAEEVEGGVLIQTGAGSSLFLGGPAAASLTADMFIF
jgi:Ca2+-binding RTX toxin-like protein